MAFTTINKSSSFQNQVLYTGNASTNAITGVNFQPDLVWGKDRGGDRHWWADAVRGKSGTGYYLLSSNNNEAQTGNYPPDGVTTIGSDGFTVGANSSNSNGGWSNEINQNSGTYVAWNWKANGAGSANTDGSINSTVSANTTSGFSIVKYTGTGSNATVGHGLGVAPSMIIFKRLVGGGWNWTVYHKSMGNNYFVSLNLTNAKSNTSSSTYFQDTTPTSSVFYIGDSGHLNGDDIIAYCFAEKQGYSKFGSYTGNGNADGAFVYTGFKPALVMVKQTNAAGEDWFICDNKREGYNAENNRLLPNLTSAESTDSPIDLLSNGFKARLSGANVNGSGASYIYMAFGQSLVGTNNIPNNAR